MADHDDHPYHAKDALGSMTSNLLIAGGFGAFVAGLQNTLTKQNLGTGAFFTKFGGTTATFAAMGASFGFTRAVSANLRETDDALNEAIGGFAAGSMIGLRVRSIPAFFGFGTGLAIIQYAYAFSGNKLTGYTSSKKEDSIYEQRMHEQYEGRRTNIKDTFAELGEGRGIFAAGYEERRRQKIKDNYGIDVVSSGVATKTT